MRKNLKIGSYYDASCNFVGFKAEVLVVESVILGKFQKINNFFNTPASPQGTHKRLQPTAVGARDSLIKYEEYTAFLFIFSLTCSTTPDTTENLKAFEAVEQKKANYASYTNTSGTVSNNRRFASDERWSKDGHKKLCGICSSQSEYILVACLNIIRIY
uniref:Uncharacterized protein n=1 Tax=Glossina austeni TaxID=7395 RepID=A0A1A9UU39_GLOAU